MVNHDRLPQLEERFAVVTARRLSHRSPRKRRAPLRPLLAAATIVVLGGSLAGATIEGQTWWLVLAAAPVFAVVAAWRRGHTAITCAGAVVVAALAIGAWALWWQGVPQLTEVFSAAPT